MDGITAMGAYERHYPFRCGCSALMVTGGVTFAVMLSRDCRLCRGPLEGIRPDGEVENSGPVSGFGVQEGCGGVRGEHIILLLRTVVLSTILIIRRLLPPFFLRALSGFSVRRTVRSLILTIISFRMVSVISPAILV